MDTAFKKVTLSVSDDLKIKGIANSLQRSRDGIKINEDAAKELVGQSVPLLINHEWNSMGIGKIAITKISEEGLEFAGHIFKSTPNLEQIKDNISEGTLSVSVGFLAGGFNKEDEATDIDLLELSLTPTPADKNASVVFQSLNQDDIKSKEEVKKMKDKKIKQATDDTDTGTDDTTASDDTSSEDAPTLQDVLDALTAIASDVADIKKSVVSDDDSSTDTSDDSSDAATQSLNNLKTEALSLVLSGNTDENFAKLYNLFR